ncbi:MAG: uroporphyrinogen-III C-methyltransferase [Pseudomonadota bacterium]
MSGNGQQPESSVDEAQGKGNSVAPSAASRLAVALGLSALVLALGLGAGGYYLWTRQHALDDQQQQITTTLRTLDTTLRSELTRGLDELRAEQQALRDVAQQMRTTLEKGRDYSAASDAEYLMRIAGHRLLLEHDLPSAVSALEEADQRLRDIDDPTLFNIRQQLIEEITQLKTVPQPDITGVSLTISSLEKQIERLSPLGAGTEAPATRPGPATQQFWDTLWSEIKNLVVIRRNDQAGLPLSHPEQRVYLQHNLRLTLETARLALLRRDTQTFRASLATARDWLARYYEQDTAAKAAQETLTHLEKIELSPPLPDITPALKNLRAWLEQSKKSVPATSQPSAAPSGTPQPSP